MKYAQTVLTQGEGLKYLKKYIVSPVIEWDEDREKFEKQLQAIISSKTRTIEVYSLIMVAVKYIYDHNRETFEELGHSWQEMEEVFLPGVFRDFVRQCHPEISRPDLVLKNYLRDVARILEGLSISEVKLNPDLRNIY